MIVESVRHRFSPPRGERYHHTYLLYTRENFPTPLSPIVALLRSNTQTHTVRSSFAQRAAADYISLYASTVLQRQTRALPIQNGDARRRALGNLRNPFARSRGFEKRRRVRVGPSLFFLSFRWVL